MKAGPQLRRWLLLGALLISVALADAREWKSEEHNCAVTLPDGWEEIQMPSPAIVTAVRNADQTITIQLAIFEPGGGTDQVVDDKFAAGFRKAIVAQGDQIVSEKRTIVGGLPAMELNIRQQANGRSVSGQMNFVIAEGKMYQLQAFGIRDQITNDSAVVECFASFHFLHPPKIPVITASSSAHRLGFQFVRVSLFVGTVVAAITAVVILARRHVNAREARSEPPASDPPIK